MLTLPELNERIDGFNTVEDMRWQRFARMFALVLSALTGSRWKGREILPEVFPAAQPLTEEEKQNELDEIKRNVGLEN